MNPLDDLIIENILRTDDNNIVLQKENTKIEYKGIFDRSNREAKAKYLKELAALHNYDGGYLIFGVNDKTNELVGLQNFSTPDNADLSKDLKAYFAPAFQFEPKSFNIENKTIYVIHVEKRKNIPTVCIREYPDILIESTVYWRYSGESAPVKAGDLINLFHSLRGEENARLADIQEKDTKAKYKPYIKAHGGGTRGSGDVNIEIINNGARATINAINVVEGTVDVRPYAKLPFVLESKQEMRISIFTSGTNWQYQQYKIEFHFNDEIGTSYIAMGEYHGISGKITDPVEIT